MSIQYHAVEIDDPSLYHDAPYEDIYNYKYLSDNDINSNELSTPKLIIMFDVGSRYFWRLAHRL